MKFEDAVMLVDLDSTIQVVIQNEDGGTFNSIKGDRWSILTYCRRELLESDTLKVGVMNGEINIVVKRPD